MRGISKVTIEQVLGYNFKNQELIITALTHSSYSNESKREEKNNERLEFQIGRAHV